MTAAESVPCSRSTNNGLNRFTPYGDCSLIRMANLFANIARLGSPSALAESLAMVSTDAARLMNLEQHSLDWNQLSEKRLLVVKVIEQLVCTRPGAGCSSGSTETIEPLLANWVARPNLLK